MKTLNTVVEATAATVRNSNSKQQSEAIVAQLVKSLADSKSIAIELNAVDLQMKSIGWSSAKAVKAAFASQAEYTFKIITKAVKQATYTKREVEGLRLTNNKMLAEAQAKAAKETPVAK